MSSENGTESTSDAPAFTQDSDNGTGSTGVPPALTQDNEKGTESTSDPPALTEDQEAFVKECEAEFGDRYTEKDTEYKKLKEAGIGDPPIVEPWYSKPRRNFDWSSRNKGRGDNRQEDSYKPRDSYRQDNSNRYHPNSRRDNYHNNKYRSHHDYRSRPY